MDAQTFLIPNFTYDGQAPDAHFHVGRGARVGPEVKEVEILTRDRPKIRSVRWTGIERIFNYEILARLVKVPRSIPNLQDMYFPVNF